MSSNSFIRLIRRSIVLVSAIGLIAINSVQAAASDRYLVRYQSGAKAEVMAALDSQAIVHHEFDELGLLAVTLPDSGVVALSNLTSVINISDDPLWRLSAQNVPYGIDLVNARDEWDANLDDIIDSGAATGNGIRLCIIDTGIFSAHEDLGAGGVTILAGRSWVGEDWFYDQQGHGTHVAGTVVAAHNDVGVVGVSPGEVDLIIADVFNDAGEGQFSSTILEAANWCADQGANIISMSLGGLQPDSAIEAGYQSLYDRGILIIAAAGNDSGPVMNFPASYSSVVSVAAIDADELVADFSNKVPQVEVAAPGVGVLSAYPVDNALIIEAGPKYSANSIANTGEPGTYSGPLADGGDCNAPATPGSFDGALVLCERGGAGTFGTKIDNAAAGGAIGVIIRNNVPGNFSGTWGNVGHGETPAISVSQEDGQDALNHLGKSSSILVEAGGASSYAELSGTSMATPHASATAAVHWSACKELNNDQMRAHLSATTRDSQFDLVVGRDPLYGYGIVQVKQGVEALTDGINEYDPLVGNGDGSNPANVECAVVEADAAKATGGGWLSGEDKINFGFNAKETSNGAAGELQLNDKAANVRIKLSSVTSIAGLTAACGPVPAGDNAIVFEGGGTINSTPASFRACVADNGEPGRGSDLFYLECTDGCSYATSSAGSDGVLAGGNLQVHVANGGGDGSGDAMTMTLDPVLLTTGVPGELQVFSAQVYDDAQQPKAGATVTLEATAADGSVEKLEAVSGPAGIAVFTQTLGSGVEYRAVSGNAESNTIGTN